MATIRRDHPYLRARDFGTDAVDQLFDSGRIALFLDGLDEMPDGLRDRAIERLKSEAAGLRVAITSRLNDSAVSPGSVSQLSYSAVVELQPVDPGTAGDYLLEGQIGAAGQAWRDVAEYLLAHPDGVLAQTLNTPLTLSLARSAYGGDPRLLLTSEPADEDVLRSKLLDRVLITAYRDVKERDHVSYWLGWLAHKMSAPDSTRDLAWWQIVTWVTGWQVWLLVGLAAALAWILAVLVGAALLLDLKLGFWIALSLGLFSGVGLASATEGKLPSVEPISTAVRWPTREELLSMAFDNLFYLITLVPVGAIVGALLAVTRSHYTVAGLEFSNLGLWRGLMLGLGVGVLAALWIALVAALGYDLVDVWRRPLSTALDVTPRSVYQRDMRSSLVRWLMAGLASGLGFALIWPLILELPPYDLRRSEAMWPRVILTVAIAWLIAFWLGRLARNATSLLAFAEIVLCLKGRPVRFMPMLETALARQVLRQAGAVYQFRHASLQDRLAEQYDARLTRDPAA
jgi:hypothetical protein